MKAVLLSAAINVSAGPASAQAATGTADMLARAILAAPRVEGAGPARDLSRTQAPSPYARALPDGIARTSVDHRFEDDGAVGSFGYLCGLNPGQRMSGAAGAAGYDPMGKFLGAKLSIAFR